MSQVCHCPGSPLSTASGRSPQSGERSRRTAHSTNQHKACPLLWLSLSKECCLFWTDLKLLVERALDEGRSARSILYLTLDLIEGAHHAELAQTITRAKALAREPGPGIVLLDEVTGVPRWQTAVKALWDDGTIAHDVVLCTGSSAIDLQRGAAERLPGRRGEGRDHLVLGQTFGSFARAIDDSIPASPCLTIADVRTPGGEAALHEGRLHAPALKDALSLYLR